MMTHFNRLFRASKTHCAIFSDNSFKKFTECFQEKYKIRVFLIDKRLIQDLNSSKESAFEDNEEGKDTASILEKSKTKNS